MICFHWCNFRRLKALIYPYQAGLFSHLPGQGMGEEGLRGLDAKRQDYHQPIKTKFYIAEIGCLMQNLSRCTFFFRHDVKIFQEGNK